MSDLEEAKRLLGEALENWPEDPLLRDYAGRNHPDQIRRNKITDALAKLENVDENNIPTRPSWCPHPYSPCAETDCVKWDECYRPTPTEETERIAKEVLDEILEDEKNKTIRCMTCRGVFPCPTCNEPSTEDPRSIRNWDELSKEEKAVRGRVDDILEGLTDDNSEEPKKCPECGGPLYLQHGGGFENIGVDVCRDCGYHPATHSTEEQTEED